MNYVISTQMLDRPIDPEYMAFTLPRLRGRWYDGNLVRFFVGTIRPIGGWLANRTPHRVLGALLRGAPRI